jgi:hypothetical protein
MTSYNDNQKVTTSERSDWSIFCRRQPGSAESKDLNGTYLGKVFAPFNRGAHMCLDWFFRDFENEHCSLQS